MRGCKLLTVLLHSYPIQLLGNGNSQGGHTNCIVKVALWVSIEYDMHSCSSNGPAKVKRKDSTASRVGGASLTWPIVMPCMVKDGELGQ